MLSAKGDTWLITEGRGEQARRVLIMESPHWTISHAIKITDDPLHPAHHRFQRLNFCVLFCVSTFLVYCHSSNSTIYDPSYCSFCASLCPRTLTNVDQQ